MCRQVLCFFFFFNDTATTEIYTLSLHDALPIYFLPILQSHFLGWQFFLLGFLDRKSTRLNSSHVEISYAVFCLKKKNKRHRNNNKTLQHTFPHLYTHFCTSH